MHLNFTSDVYIKEGKKKQFLILAFLFTFCISAAQNVPNYNPHIMTTAQLQAYRQSIWDTLPAAVGWVNDFEGLFDGDQENTIEKTLSHFEKKTSIEISIITVDSNMINKNSFDEFSYRVMKLWGIGKISKSNGMVICISKDYKRLCVTTDFGIDKYMNAAEKDKIINKYFLPFYRKNDYYQGTVSGLNAILEKIGKRWDKENGGKTFLTL